MFIIKYVNADGSFTYSPLDPECKEPKYGDSFNSEQKALKFLKKNILLNGEIPAKFNSVHICEMSQGYVVIRKNFLRKL